LNYLFIYTKQQLTLEKTEGALKNGQSRDIGNIGRTRHRTKIKKIQNQNTETMQKTKMMSNTDLTKTRG